MSSMSEDYGKKTEDNEMGEVIAGLFAVLTFVGGLFFSLMGVFGGYDNHYEPKELVISENEVVIYTQSTPGWFEKMWEGEKEVVFRWDRSEDQYKDAEGNTVGTTPFGTLVKDADIRVINETQGRNSSVVTMGIDGQKWKFVRTASGEWYDEANMLLMDNWAANWKTKLKGKLERCYLKYQATINVKEDDTDE